ncbi:MAG: hypothetical protein V4532_00390, partial [Pseudomonadota bacterium]
RTRSARALSQSLRDWVRLQDDAPASGKDSSGRASASKSSAKGGKDSRPWMWPLAAAGWAAAIAGVGWASWQAHKVPEVKLVPPVIVAIPAAAVPAAAVVSLPEPAVVSAPGVLTAVPIAVESIASAAQAPVLAETTTASAAPVMGVVKLAISPWGEVFDGRQSLGVTPPLTQLSLPVGRHVLVIRNGDSKPLRKTIDVKAGASVVIEHQF